MELNGPIFDGAAGRAVADMVDEMEREIAQRGLDLVQARLMQVIRKPTPYYWTQIDIVSRRGGREITGESVIYHWWLEGKGSRNYPVTRFKGYHTFEITTGTLRSQAEQVAEPIVRQYVIKMGGS